jgi:predicted N-acetyltransferase YhbS
MKPLIQPATQKDFKITETLTREAFWNVYKPGCDEHRVLNRLRNSKSYISELDLVAVCENKIVGHIISTKAKVIDSQDFENEVLCVGPVSVIPEFQKNGIGSKLINESIKVATELGFPGMILFGNPEYYHRFGFINAENYGITTKDGQNFEPFMALELLKESLNNVHGKFFEDEGFTTNEEELEEFEKQFPFKEKRITETQLKL